MKSKYLSFDVMQGERFVCTLRMPLNLDTIAGYIGDEPVVKGEKIRAYVEQKRPTLIGKDYQIAF